MQINFSLSYEFKYLNCNIEYFVNYVIFVKRILFVDYIDIVRKNYYFKTFKLISSAISKLIWVFIYE